MSFSKQFDHHSKFRSKGTHIHLVMLSIQYSKHQFWGQKILRQRHVSWIQQPWHQSSHFHSPAEFWWVFSCVAPQLQPWPETWRLGKYPNIQMGVSKNRGGPPKSSILIRFSSIFTIHFGGPPLFLETPKYPNSSKESRFVSYRDGSRSVKFGLMP